MESQPQNPEFMNNPKNFHPCNLSIFIVAMERMDQIKWRTDSKVALVYS